MVIVKLTCTDRDYRVRYAYAEVRGQTFQLTRKEREALYDKWNREFTDERGSPYIFSETVSANE